MRHQAVRGDVERVRCRDRAGEPHLVHADVGGHSVAPLSYEAKALEGRIHLARGWRLQESGEYPAALEAYARAGEALASATDIARSDPALYLEGCRRQEAVLNIQIRSGRARPDAFAPAMVPCERAIQAEPAQVAAYALASRLCARRASDYLEAVGVDPEPLLARVSPVPPRRTLANRLNFGLPSTHEPLDRQGRRLAFSEGRPAAAGQRKRKSADPVSGDLLVRCRTHHSPPAR